MLVMNSMYQPGGARFRLFVTEAVSEVAVRALIGRSIRRCSVSSECVGAPGRIRLIHLIPDACGVWILTVPPYAVDCGAL